ncbi:MAG: protease modulator HflC [Pseudodesulfovibrio sp.]|uniref:Protein HflC n=1 Tax=Pseudodesulfovibrio aespoeensis (strain ATCC 700646 / DSM 10631 / Aspo-2) TaxID=643562 RepID=E6VV67_PSEA9|nr:MULTISPECIES: protease modulator HflC [Pseudodesulfovibrio]MBU4244031.1 protease modulator HflC [Pseudomonadota bacterium]ADU61218.1 HflC protein [Pseudodesulfovibrio aespoeensis Aspo-2]MBU4378309.1 protease modulator HflC [Pseudomonadota bacterium]MBU4474276.1 protease modulator HflC [Pseudomonadota bacterium]MBU4516945.1 protease modulator HflC [Pseudomonadota bacterium]
MKTSTIALIVLVIVAAVGLTQAAFTVDQTERAIVLQLGRPVGDTALEPGLHFKIPLVQNVVFFDSRILDFDAKPEEITTTDKKYMNVDSYTKWRIFDPLTFYTKVRTVQGAQARLDDIVRSQLRVAVGRYTLIEVVSHKRQEIMTAVTKRASELLHPYGIEVLDVRIKRTDLPPENARAIFGRMKAERERQAKQYRSEGREVSAKIIAEADKERSIILADAEKESEIIRGDGDAQATKIYADALGRAPEFYEFTRSLDAYRKSFGSNSRFIMTPNSQFLQHMQ